MMIITKIYCKLRFKNNLRSRRIIWKFHTILMKDTEWVYNICLGQSIHGLEHSNSIPFDQFSTFDEITDYVEEHSKVLVFLGEGLHKIKKESRTNCVRRINK